MKTKLIQIGTIAVACAAFQLTAMPTEEETRRAEPAVQRLLARERLALKSGRKTRSEVAATAVKLAGKANSEAEKLLLMKGAFVLYVQDDNLKKAGETLDALETAIPDIPQQYVTNIIDAALLGVSEKDAGARLYRLLDEEKAETTTEKTRKDLARLFPGWSLDSEVPQENNKDVASGFCKNHRGQDKVLRLHPVNKETPVVLSRTMTLSNKNPCLFLKVSSWNGESDFLLSVRVNGKETMAARLVRTSALEPWEDLVVPLFDWRGRSVKIEIVLEANDWNCEWSHFARIEIAEGNGDEECGLVGVKNGTETVDGYTWSYFIKNGEATVAAAISPSPKGDITIPATLGGVKVTGIGKRLFYSCEEVTSVTIPEGVTCIGPSAFDLCFGLTSVTIPSSVKTIEEWAFSACFQMQLVTMPESLEYIGKGAFINCKSLKKVNLPAKLSVIGESAFAYCDGLGSVTVPASVAKIGRGAFYDCGELTEVTMFGECPEVPNDIFNKACGKLKSIHVPANAKSWTGMKEWQGIPLISDDDVELRYGVVDGGAILVSRKGFGFWPRPGLTQEDVKSTTLKVQPSGTVVIPHTIDGVPVREIGDWSFHDCPELRSVTIPSCVTNIGKDAFNDCGARSVFRVAEGNPFYKSVSGHLLTKDGETLVWGVNVNGNLSIPEGVKCIAYNAFRDCAGITGVTFPDGVTRIGNWAFHKCTGLKDVTFPGSVNHIEWGTFCGCSGLESVTICNGVTDIGGVAFEYCRGLKSVSIPEGVTGIGYKAFHECKALTGLRIPSTVKHIRKEAFWDCSELTSVTMLGECPETEDDVFKGCDKLNAIHVPANAKSWEGMKDWLGIPLVFDVK